MKDITEVYLAAGGKLSEDGSGVIMGPDFKPFDIRIKVIPKGMEFSDGLISVTFSICIPAEQVLGETTHLGTPLKYVEFHEEFTLPLSYINAIDLIKDE